MRRVLVLALALVCGCAFRASGPEVTGVRAVPAADGFAVSWRLTTPGFARLDWWETAQPAGVKNSAVRALPGVDFREVATGCRPDTAYTWRIVAGAAASLDDDAVRTAPAELRTPPAIGISDISVSVEGSSARVSWRTARPTDSTVLYGRTDDLEARRSDPAQRATRDHALVLPALEPGQSYRLEVVATDAAGEAPLATSSPVPFVTPAGSATRVSRITPRQAPKSNTLAQLSHDYLDRLTSMSPSERREMEKAIQSASPDERLELSPAERTALTSHPTDPADRAAFLARVDLVQRWIIHLGQRGRDVTALSNVAVALENRYLVAPAQAAADLDRAVKTLAAME